MAMVQSDEQRAGAEIVTDPEECLRRSQELLDEIGFPRGVMPLKDMVECGRVRETGFVWMKQKAPSEHYFESTKSLVSYAVEVTAYVEKGRMKKMTGVKTKQVLFWMTLVEMSIEESSSRKIYFKTSLGVGRFYPVKAFWTEEERMRYADDQYSSNLSLRNNNQPPEIAAASTTSTSTTAATTDDDTGEKRA